MVAACYWSAFLISVLLTDPPGRAWKVIFFVKVLDIFGFIEVTCEVTVTATLLLSHRQRVNLSPMPDVYTDED